MMRAILVAGMSLLLMACSTWHSNLMSNEQLLAADCSQLAVEEQKVADNANHMAQVASGGGIGAGFLAVLEGMAASANGTPYNTSNSAAMEQARLSDEDRAQSRELEQRRQLISSLRSKRGCTAI